MVSLGHIYADGLNCTFSIRKYSAKTCAVFWRNAHIHNTPLLEWIYKIIDAHICFVVLASLWRTRNEVRGAGCGGQTLRKAYIGRADEFHTSYILEVNKQRTPKKGIFFARLPAKQWVCLPFH